MSTAYQNIHQPIIDRCLLGERQAQYEIYQLYAKAMFNSAYRITRNDQDAEDVLQDSFVSAFKNLKSYKGTAAFGSWLKRIVVNNAINLVKKRRLQFESVEDSPDVDALTNEVEDADMSYEVDMVKEGISKLPEGYRLVITLYLLDGFDHKEIASVLEITESTSKSQYNRAKKRLREILKNELKYAG